MADLILLVTDGSENLPKLMSFQFKFHNKKHFYSQHKTKEQLKLLKCFQNITQRRKKNKKKKNKY